MIYLIRHGETDWNVVRRVQGNTDIPLNENGKSQARDVSEKIANLKINRIISSDLSRAKETAEIINKKVNTDIILDNRLREVNYGDLEGELIEDFTEETWNTFFSNPEKSNGESRKNVYIRIKSFLDELSKEEGNSLVVTHGGALRMMMYYSKNKNEFNNEEYMDYIKDVKIHNTEIIEFENK